jgi:flagellar hook-basal body complex protein FliE
MSVAIPGIGAAGAITSVFGPVSASAGESSGSGFTGVLTSALNQVSGMQNDATQQVNTVMAGGSADMSKVMISVEKADVAFQLMMQVRNKVVSAYQDIEKMQF